jgi:hypothetical protein
VEWGEAIFKGDTQTDFTLKLIAGKGNIGSHPIPTGRVNWPILQIFRFTAFEEQLVKPG